MMAEIPMPDREELVRLRQQGFTRDEIATYYNVSLSRVKRWIKELDIPSTLTSVDGKTKLKASEGAILPEDYGLTLIERAHKILGRRVGRKYGGYTLDGRVVRVDVLIRAAGLKVPDVP